MLVSNQSPKLAAISFYINSGREKWAVDIFFMMLIKVRWIGLALPLALVQVRGFYAFKMPKTHWR
jgi:hypothetical protein